MTKIYYGRDLIGRFTCDGKRYTRTQRLVMAVKHYTKVGAFLGIATVFVVGFAMGYNHFNAKTVYAEKVTTVVVPSTDIPPVMMRIAKCESGATHYRNGQVIFNGNNNKTVDIGFFQINSIHSKQASAMGLDLTKESDNIEFGMYLYQNFGTEPWYSSKACWYK
jgi:hypothetical protein